MIIINKIIKIRLMLIDRVSRMRAVNANAIHPQIKPTNVNLMVELEGKVREPSKTVDVVQTGRHRPRC